MKLTGVNCPRCGERTDQSPCSCGYEFPENGGNAMTKKELNRTLRPTREQLYNPERRLYRESLAEEENDDMESSQT